MVYRVLANGVDILGSETDSALLNPSLQTELNSAGSFNFTLPPDHPAYDDVNLLTTMIEVYEDGDLIFFGRPSEISIDWFNQKKVVCEGALAYLNDTVLRPHIFEGALISDVFKHIIAQHNSQVDQNRQFVVGDITITDRYVYTDIGYDNCFSVLKSTCIDSTGGYLFTRLEENETIYIDWLKEVPYSSDQPVQFASNLLDLKQDTKAEDICTVVLPLGGQIDGVDLTIASVNDDSDILEDETAIALYGRVTKVMQWSDILDAQSLKDKAQDWLTDEQYDKLSIEVNAAELHYLDGSVGAYKVGQMVQVISGPHNITKEVPIIKMDISLDSGVKKVSLGTPPREELTEISSGMIGSGGYSSGSYSGGGGGGSSSGGVRDVLVNGSSVVSDHVARVSVPTDTVTTSQLTTALATKANTSDIINIVANPSGTATDELNSIQIGNDVYEITGGEYVHHYSTSEKAVGTWIDGSTVYEKTFTGFSVTLQSGVLKDTGINVSYISKVISFTALSDDYLAIIPVAGYKINGTLQMIGYQNGNVIDKCIVRYTKT